MPRSAFHYGCSTLALAALAMPVHAQETGDAPPPVPVETAPPGDGTLPAAPEQRLVYTPSDFAQYAPRSALDMLQQVPGFAIQESGGQGGGFGQGGGQGQARGLGQATGNVLLNGERISSKSDSVTQRLSRIAAANVVRIELVDGSTLNIPGLSGRVANIVTTGGAAVSGQFEWNPQLGTAFAKARIIAGRASVTGKTGPVSYTFAAENNPFYGGTGGPNFITDAAGLVEERFSRTQSVLNNPKLSTTLRIDAWGDSVANFNASHQWTRGRSMEDEFVVVPAGLPSRLEEIRNRDRGRSYELGGDYEFGLGPGRLKLIGLESYRRSAFSTQGTFEPNTGALRTGSRFTNSSRSGERIGRAEYSWKMFGGDAQLSAEGAFNRLNNVATLAFLRPSGEFVAIPFPSGTGGVTEDRYETIVSFGRPLTPTLSLQVSGGGEYSKIAQTGANALARTFLRPKGSLALAWAPSDGLDISFRAARKVGQLNFGDFLADVNLQNDITNAGNNELRPEQSWEFNLEVAKDLGPWGSVTLELFDNRIDDYVTVIPLLTGGESVGNIDSARTYGALLKGTIRLDPIGIRGAKFDLDAHVRKSKLIDPVTGVVRAFDRLQPRAINVEFRHDVPNTDLAYGGGVRSARFNPYYRVAEFGYDYNIATQLRAFIEHKDVFGLTVQARFNNILRQDNVLDRVVYAGPRDRSPVLFRENRRREVGHIINFTVKGSF